MSRKERGLHSDKSLPSQYELYIQAVQKYKNKKHKDNPQKPIQQIKNTKTFNKKQVKKMGKNKTQGYYKKSQTKYHGKQ